MEVQFKRSDTAEERAQKIVAFSGVSLKGSHIDKLALGIAKYMRIDEGKKSASIITKAKAKA